jgi:hypothetical protein
MADQELDAYFERTQLVALTRHTLTPSVACAPTSRRCAAQASALSEKSRVTASS